MEPVAAPSPDAPTESLSEIVRGRPNVTKVFTVEEVRKHSTKDDCWVIVDRKVYNVTTWIDRHPGGELLILNVAGMDITDAFLVNHLPWVREKMLPLYQVGIIEGAYKPPPESSDLQKLALELERDGWYETDYLYYLQLIIWYALLFFAAIRLILQGRNVLTRCIVPSVLMAIFWQQIAFLGHDLGHMAVTHRRVVDNLIGVVGGNIFMGIAIGWWKATHNVHHLVTNYLEYDPDIQHLPVLAISQKFFNGVHSVYHARFMPFDAIARFFVAHQHILFYPIMFVARFNLYLQSFLLLSNPEAARKRGVTFPRLELLMLLCFHAWLFWLCSRFPSWIEGVTFLFLSHGLAGMLHVQICISHFPMEVMQIDTCGKPLEKTPFLNQQLATCLDVDCHPALDWVHGGLQFQTAHHVFPLCPRHKLRALVPKVEALGSKYKLRYSRVDFFEANSMIIQCLKNTADEVHPWLHALLNAEG